MKDYKQAAEALFQLLDDIDTVGDWAKDNNKAYRQAVEKIQAKRFEWFHTDGYTLTLKD